MKKRVIAILMAMVMAAGVCACGDDKSHRKDKSKSEETSSGDDIGWDDGEDEASSADPDMITDANGFTHKVVPGVDPSYYDNPNIESVSEDGNIIKYKNGALEVLDTDLLNNVNVENPVDVVNEGLSNFPTYESNDTLKEAVERGVPFWGNLFYGENAHNIIGLQYDNLSENGYKVSLDETTLFSSGEISDEFKVESKSGNVFYIKIMNPYEKANPASLCVVCYERVEASSNNASLNLDSTLMLGKCTYDDVEKYFYEPYEKTANEMHYKTFFNAMNSFSTVNYGTNSGDKIYESGNDLDVIIGFKNGTLDSVSMEDRALLFHGIQDNVSEDDLYNLEPSYYDTVSATTEDIVSEIQENAQENGVDISNIDSTSGKVAMDSTFLFEFNKSDLTKEGLKYLDEFLTVYASVLLDDSNYDSIKEIVIEGHTDSQGSYENNLTLSEKRAKSVLDYCLKSNALSNEQKARLKKKVTSKGFSYTDLVYDENGNEDPDASRRVCFKFLVNVD